MKDTVLTIEGLLMRWLIGVVFLTSALPAAAAETVTYVYDARGRLVQVIRSGGPVSGTQVTYAHDQADNRTSVQVVGAPQ